MALLCGRRGGGLLLDDRSLQGLLLVSFLGVPRT
jgi:hypothetical protein